MRSPRQSETKDRVLSAALQQFREQGLTVGIDHIGLEQVIKGAGVSRATAYRIWPNKRQFLADVIVAAVAGTELRGETGETMGAFQDLLRYEDEFVSDPTVRRHIIVDAVRMSSTIDFDHLVTSPAWASFLALEATTQGINDPDLRARVSAALRDTDDEFTAQRAAMFARLPSLLGYRLVPPLEGEAGFSLLSTSAGALMTGLLIKSRTRPELFTDTFEAAAFGAGPLEWTVPTYTLTSHLLSFLEPDPLVIWDDAQRARFRREIAELLAALG